VAAPEVGIWGRRCGAQQPVRDGDRVEIYREFNALYFQLPPARLAELLVGELVKAGAARIVSGEIVPAVDEAG